MRLSDPTQLTLRGDLAERLERAARHLCSLNTEEMWRELVDPDPMWHWGADYPGRWVGTMALLEQQMRADYGVAAAVERLVGYQQADGSFGLYSEPYDYKEWFGMGRGLVGLLDAHTATNDPAMLAAAGRLGGYYVERYPTFEPYMYECYSNALEGLVLLARLTEEERFLETARRMADTSMAFRQIWYSTTLSPQGRRAPCGGQIHCQLTTARGLVDLYELTDDARYLTPVLELHHFIVRETLSIAGGVGFYFNRPEENETCADADWLRLNLQLWRLTGETRYLELAEQTLVNQLPFAQAANGAFCYLRGLQNRSGAVFDVCCSHHGPRALWEALRYAITTEPGAISINLFLDATARLTVGDSELTISTDPRDDGADLILTTTLVDPPLTPLTVRVRKPAWACAAIVSINGTPVETNHQRGYVTVERAWTTGDRIEVRFRQRVQVIRGHRLGQHVLHADEAAVLRGPRLFCLSDLHNPAVGLDLVRLRLAADAATGFRVSAPDRIEGAGLTAEGRTRPLLFTPLSATGGMPNGSGRSHPALAPPFKTWVRVE